MNECLIGLFVLFLMVVIIVTIIFTLPVENKPYYTPLTTLPRVKNDIIPKKVCIFMVATPEIQNYAKYTIEVNKKYCERHGYTFRLIDTNLTPDLSVNFSKIQATLDLMEEKDKNGRLLFDYIMHIDADAIVKEINYEVTNIIAKYLIWPVSFIAGEDCYTSNKCSKPNKMNSGVFIVTNSILGKAIMNNWLNSSRNECKELSTQFPSCQLVFTHCTIKKWFFAIRIIPYNTMNGRDGLFIEHLMQGKDRERIDEFREEYKKYSKWNEGDERLTVFS
jgi:hypothetical protein